MLLFSEKENAFDRPQIGAHHQSLLNVLAEEFVNFPDSVTKQTVVVVL